MVNTSKLIKKCPRCHTDIEPERYATTGDKVLAGFYGACAAVLGFSIGGPVGAVAGATAGYYGSMKTIMSIEDDHDKEQWFKYVCPKCGIEWKEEIHTNDHPDDPSWISNQAY